MRSITGLLALFSPAAAFAAGHGARASFGDISLVLIGIAVAALISRRRRGLPESHD